LSGDDGHSVSTAPFFARAVGEGLVAVGRECRILRGICQSALVVVSKSDVSAGGVGSIEQPGSLNHRKRTELLSAGWWGEAQITSQGV
jgi:hypothetical protein